MLQPPLVLRWTTTVTIRKIMIAGAICSMHLRAPDLTYRDYGGLLRLSGYDGSVYHLDVPALAALAGNVDLNYAGFNPKVRDAARGRRVRSRYAAVRAGRPSPEFYLRLDSDAGQHDRG